MQRTINYLNKIPVISSSVTSMTFLSSVCDTVIKHENSVGIPKFGVPRLPEWHPICYIFMQCLEL